MTGKILLVFIIFLSFLLSVSPLHAEKIFHTIERIRIATDDYYPYINDLTTVPDGYVLLCEQSAATSKPILVKLNLKGISIATYGSHGYGPGELTKVNSLCFSEGEILATEFFTPVIHVFSTSLEFKKDIRIKKGGNILFADKRFIAVWSMHYEKEFAYMVTLYDRNDYSFKRYAFPISRESIPAFVHFYGSFIPIDGNRYAGIYSNSYKIKIFSDDFNFETGLLKNAPAHVKKYRPWKRNRSIVDTMSANDWIASWTVLHSLFYVDGVFLINYREGGNFYIDFASRKGKIIHTGQKVRWYHLYSDGKFLWRIERENEDEEEPDLFLVKEKLSLR